MPVWATPVSHLHAEPNLTHTFCLTVRTSKQDICREGSLGFRQGRVTKLHPRYDSAAPRVWPRCAEPGGLGLLEHFEPIHPQLHAWGRKERNPPNYSTNAMGNSF